MARRDGPQYLSEIGNWGLFRIAPFDQRAAVELAVILITAIASGDKRSGVKESWNKVKFDNQIVAIAKANNVTTIYCNDEGLAKFAEQQGLSVVRCWQLPPPQPKQQALPLSYGSTGPMPPGQSIQPSDMSRPSKTGSEGLTEEKAKPMEDEETKK